MKLDKKEVKINGSGLKIAIILPYFNESIGLKLLENAKAELLKNNVPEENIDVIRVAGALEIPYACKKTIENKKPNAIIALGVIIKGETGHHKFVAENCFQGIMQIQLNSGIPISFGILTCENVEQAKKRINKGKEAAQAALIQTSL